MAHPRRGGAGQLLRLPLPHLTLWLVGEERRRGGGEGEKMKGREEERRVGGEEKVRGK